MCEMVKCNAPLTPLWAILHAMQAQIVQVTTLRFSRSVDRSEVSKKRREWPEIRTIKAAANKQRKQKEHCLKTLQGWAHCVISKVSVQHRRLNAKCRKWKGTISMQQNETNCQIFFEKNLHNLTFQRRFLTLQRSILCCHALWNSLLDSRRFQGIRF